MEKVTFDRSQRKLPKMLGITKERLIELEAHCEKSMIRLKRETEQNGTIGYQSTRVIEEFVSGAANEQELVFLTADAVRMIFELKEVQEKLIPPSLMDVIQRVSRAQEKQQTEKQS